MTSRHNLNLLYSIKLINVNYFYMKKSPFHDYANALLKIPEVSIGSGIDKYGNQTIERTYKEYQCILEPAKADEVSTQYMPGKNSNSIFLKGYLVNPLAFSPDMKFPCDCEMEMKMGPGYVQEGQIRLIYPVSNPYLLGEKLDIINQVVGWFWY